MSATQQVAAPRSTVDLAPEALPSVAPAPQEIVLQAGFAYIVSACLNVAMKLGIPDLLGTSARHVDELAVQCGANPDCLFRILRVLESNSMAMRTGEKTFALTEAGLLLRSDTECSLADSIEWLTDPFHFQVYAELRHAVQTGDTAFNAVHRQPFFEWIAKPENAEESAVFNNAMTSFSGMCSAAFLQTYDFGHFNRIIDVGGGHGALLRSILKAHPHLSGVVADMANLIPDTRMAIAADGLQDRCEAVACDFFQSVPADGDCYLMKHIIHDWEDSAALRILHNIHSAMRPEARLVLAECVIQDGAAPHPGKLLDIEMMALVGGKERTESEFRELLLQAGFRIKRVLPTNSPVSLIEAVAN